MIRNRAINPSGMGLDVALLLVCAIALLVTLGITASELQQAARQRAQGAELVISLNQQQELLRGLSVHTIPAATAGAEDLEVLRQWREDAQGALEALSRKVAEMDHAALAGPMQTLDRRWAAMVAEVDRILSSQPDLLALRERAERVARGLADLVARLEKLAEQRISAGVSPTQSLLAVRLLNEAQGLLQAVERLRLQGLASLSTPAQLAAGMDRFALNLTRLRSGDVDPLSSTAIAETGRDSTQELGPMLASLRRDSESLIDLAQRLNAAGTALADLPARQAEVAEGIERLVTAYVARPQSSSGLLGAIPALAWAGALLTIVALGLLGWRLLTKVGRVAHADVPAYGPDQGAILRLIDEIGGITEGDLTVAATPGDDLTGAIADAFNQAIAALRKMVAWGSAAVQALAESTAQMRNLANRLNATSVSQHESIAAADATLSELETQVANLVRRGSESAEVAGRLVQVAARGTEVLRDALRGIDGVTEQSKVAANRVERLTEGVHEIGNVSASIDDLADQTDILAVNGAMQAANAGEAGRPLVGLIDEVRQLAGQTREAARQIQTVLRNVTADAVEVGSLIETGGDELQKGANLIEGASEALAEIETVAGYVDGLMKEGGDDGGALTRFTNAIKAELADLRESSGRLGADADQANEVVTALSQPVQELRRAVAGFRLAE